MWTCSACTFQNTDALAGKCCVCESSRPTSSSSSWKCGVCTLQNANDVTACAVCGSRFAPSAVSSSTSVASSMPAKPLASVESQDSRPGMKLSQRELKNFDIAFSVLDSKYAHLMPPAQSTASVSSSTAPIFMSSFPAVASSSTGAAIPSKPFTSAECKTSRCSSPVSASWNCVACTFENPGSVTSCSMCLSARQDRDWAGEWLVLDDDSTPDAASSDSAIASGRPRTKRAAVAASSVIVIDDEEVDPAPAPIPVYQPPPRGVDIDAFFRERATDLQARGLASQCIAPSVSLTARRRKPAHPTNRLPPPPSVLARQAFVEANKRTVIKNGRVVVRAPRKSTAKAASASASSTLTGPAVGVDPDAGKKWLIRTVYGVSLPRLTALDVQSPAALAMALCRSAGAERTVDRAELCFKWVAMNVRYDMVEFRRRSRTPGSQDPDVVLRDRKGVCVGYAQLFAEMCAFVQVECTTVCGDCITSDGGGPHMWNAVKLANRWCVCDPCWASGHRGEDGSFNSCLDMNWWCTTPDLFIKTHLPDAQKWQLLDKPISKADFERYKR